MNYAANMEKHNFLDSSLLMSLLIFHSNVGFNPNFHALSRGTTGQTSWATAHNFSISTAFIKAT